MITVILTFVAIIAAFIIGYKFGYKYGGNDAIKEEIKKEKQIILRGMIKLESLEELEEAYKENEAIINKLKEMYETTTDTDRSITQ